MRLTLAIITSVAWSTHGAAQAPVTPQKAGDRYKSVRVLNDAPASQVIETMAVIAGSLEVTCAHCHEADFASDARPMKQKAREMILLTRAVDRTFGSQGFVTCNTCHQGQAAPPRHAPVEQAAWLRPGTTEDAGGLPTAVHVLDRYVKAVGGAERVQAVPRRVVTGTVTRDNGRTAPARGTFTLEQELPGTARMDTEFSFPPEAQSELTAEFFRPRRTASLVTRARVSGRGTIRSRRTVILDIAGAPGGAPYRLHFDEGDGLLVARESE